ncbi:hypothetical protein DM02DRAFT_563308 [Periconia macrospinosa]|uniref:AAA+ ATPase domain-containing protein n=1 Tax=Periconia macrospinosa TaxID=97972 RepID=A0A2V1DQB6_9PLEO|nr:hypothetical protein DM02DRAFT_563308 [Periconia macrospinosa]
MSRRPGRRVMDRPPLSPPLPPLVVPDRSSPPSRPPIFLDQNSGSLNVLEGYAALSRDETADSVPNPHHLRMINDKQYRRRSNHDSSIRQPKTRNTVPPSSRTSKSSSSISSLEENRILPQRTGIRRETPQRYQYVEEHVPVDEYSVTSSSPSIVTELRPEQRTSTRDSYLPSRTREPSADLPLVTSKHIRSSVDEILDELEALREENERLKHGHPKQEAPTQPAVLAYTSRTFYKIGQSYYLDQPHWEPGEGGNVVLLANNPIRNISYYLDQHPEIAFAVYKEYSPYPPADRTKIETKDGVYRDPEPLSEYISLIADSMLDAVEELVQRIPDFGEFFPYFDPESNIPAPYLFMYYSEPFVADVLPDLDLPSQDLIKQLQKVISKSHGYEYESAKLQTDKGMVSRHLMKYLIRPGDVLITQGSFGLQAYIAMAWIEKPEKTLEEEEYEEYDRTVKKRVPRYGSLAQSGGKKKKTTYEWKIPAWCWKFDGVFSKYQVKLRIEMSIGYDEEAIGIRSLNVYPLKFAPQETRSLLEKRGRIFWSARHKRFVSYLRSTDDELHNIEDRYMVDTKAYKTMYPLSDVAQIKLRADISPLRMADDKPPEGDALLVFPPSVMAYNLLQKSWRELYVDRIADIEWNKQAFQDLVAEPETKELVQALVMKQLAFRESTDFVIGKGNGLIMLLHGAPGTGKTFTAEGVAEFSEKPLLRVTCGDIGTDAQEVDHQLRATFELGKMWDCVVLLDEADVFLEERDMKDLARNALVSVFLRALEYYEGILILTSNRVGTFDEAFKSRIQLALHYENLGPIQRRKIWRNFMNRIRAQYASSDEADIEDILDHLDDLSKEVMNGREIRNAITIARQLAQFKEEPFRYSHLKHVIGVGSKFGMYLKDLRMGLTDDDIKQDSGLRLSYSTAVSERP